MTLWKRRTREGEIDYLTLVAPKEKPGSIADWCNDRRITAAAPTILEEAQDWIYRRLRHWRMLTPPTTGSLTINLDNIALPADLLEPDTFILTPTVNTPMVILEQRTMQEVVSLWVFDANGNRITQQPRYYWFDRINFNFDSVADQPYPWMLIYYQQPAPLSAANPTNFLTNFCKKLVRTACMVAACEWLKESGQGQISRDYWEEQAEKELLLVQAESDRAKRAVQGGAAVNQWPGDATLMGAQGW